MLRPTDSATNLHWHRARSVVQAFRPASRRGGSPEGLHYDSVPSRPNGFAQFAIIVCAACLALAVSGRAQTTGKTADSGKTQKKSAAALKAEENYKTLCQTCHLADGKGLTPDMSFTDGQWKHGSTPEALAKSIREGVKGTLMLPFKDKLSEAEIGELVKLVKAFEPKKPAGKK